MTTASWGGKGLFGFLFHIIVHCWRESGQELKQGRNLEAGVEAGADTETMEGAAYWLDPHGLSGLLSYRTWDHRSRADPTHNGLDSLLSITNKDNAPQMDFIRHFLSWSSCLSDNSSLCQVTIFPASIT